MTWSTHDCPIREVLQRPQRGMFALISIPPHLVALYWRSKARQRTSNLALVGALSFAGAAIFERCNPVGCQISKSRDPTFNGAYFSELRCLQSGAACPLAIFININTGCLTPGVVPRGPKLLRKSGVVPHVNVSYWPISTLAPQLGHV